VRRAIDDLITERLVERRRGVGTFVARPQGATRSVSLVGSLYDALAYPSNITIEVLLRTAKAAPRHVAELLSLQNDAALVELQVLSRVGKTPFAMTYFYLPADIGAKLQVAKLGAGTPLAAWWRHCWAKKLCAPPRRSNRNPQTQKWQNCSISSRNSDIARAAYLLQRLRQAVEVASVRYRPDQYCLRVDLVTNPPPAR